MKGTLNSNYRAAFSIVELLIAIALLATIITSVLQSNFSLQYWRTTIAVAHEAIYLTKGTGEYFSVLTASDFFAASSTLEALSEGGLQPCVPARVCYVVENIVNDVSPCVKNVVHKVSWKLSERYPTSSIELYSQFLNNRDILARGGDCSLSSPRGSWGINEIRTDNDLASQAQFTTGIDVFDSLIFITSSSSPQLRIYSVPNTPAAEPVLVSSATGTSKRINSIDVVRNITTGRVYGYVMMHTTSNQLGVFDVTYKDKPEWVTEVSLFGVPSNGSFPQGWRVVAYSKRLYVLTRETAGAEFHIFDISNPRQPQEIISAARNLGRTVNDLTVREQSVNGSLRRYVFLAASAALNELEVLDVTNDSVTPVHSVDLPGAGDASSLCLMGNSLYLGRKNNGGPELYDINVTSLLQSSFLAEVSEVGADVLSLGCSGKYLFLSTNRVGAQFQVWESDSLRWSTTTVNAGRLGISSIPRLVPLGLALTEEYVYINSQSNTQPEVMRTLSSI